VKLNASPHSEDGVGFVDGCFDGLIVGFLVGVEVIACTLTTNKPGI